MPQSVENYLEKYNKLKEESAAAEAKKAVYLQELQKLGCASVEEARDRLVRLRAEQENLGSRISVLVGKIDGALQ